MNHLVNSCETLTHEKVRSDHIAVFADCAFDKDSVNNITSKYRSIKKVNWSDWKANTEEKFDCWKEMREGVLEHDVESLYESVTDSLNEFAPEKEHKNLTNKKPHWWNSDVGAAKKNINYWKKQFKRRSTVQVKERLLEAEQVLESAVQTAIEQWSDNLIQKFEHAASSKERWDVYHSMTKKSDSNSVLPLIDSNNNVYFEEEQKCQVLQQFFFDEAKSNSNFDEAFKDELDKKVDDTWSNKDLENTENAFNSDFLPQELDLAIHRLKVGKSPGPDSLYPELFKNAGANLREAIRDVFNQSWRSGSVPKIWKYAEVKFLRKTGKSSYYSAASYRPISLTCILGKLLERMVLYRLEAHIEGNNLIDPQQEGFRKYHSTNYAVLRLTQAITSGFNAGLFTLACFVDLAKAFDSVWRKGLLYKLSELGIEGRLWAWIYDFLHARTAACKIANTRGQNFNTLKGLPQGSVISPILFSIFIIDMFKEVKGDHCKFADDGTLWHTGHSLDDLKARVTTDMMKLSDWCYRWRMTLSLPKTEVTLFTPQKSDSNCVDIVINSHTLKYNETPKLLGITLDEHLTYRTHINNTAKRAAKSLKIIRDIKGIEKISSGRLLQLYTSLVRPIMEYGSTIWQTAKPEDLHPLRDVQKTALALCLNVTRTVSLDALEVASGIPPIDLHLQGNAIKEVSKILSKDVSQPIKAAMITSRLEEKSGHRFIGPLTAAEGLATEMFQTTGLNVQLIQSEPTYDPGSLGRFRSPPEYWSQLGSSKSRSKEQEVAGQLLIEDLLIKTPPRSTLSFTDGSCQGNPGPCGAGAVLYIPDSNEGVELVRPVSLRGSILIGELVAILVVLEYCIAHKLWEISTGLQLFTDSQSAAGILTLGWSRDTYQNTIKKIEEHMQMLANNNFPVNISWTPGHSSVQGNDVADRLAKKAAQEASMMPDTSTIVTHNDVKQATKKLITTKWQSRWDLSNVGRQFYELKPKVDSKCYIDLPNPLAYNQIMQLRLGCGLNDYKAKLHGENVSPECSCGTRETVQHYLLDCLTYEQHRDHLEQTLRVKLGVLAADVILLLGYTGHDYIDNWRNLLLEDLAEFIKKTERFTANLSRL